MKCKIIYEVVVSVKSLKATAYNAILIYSLLMYNMFILIFYIDLNVYIIIHFNSERQKSQVQVSVDQVMVRPRADPTCHAPEPQSAILTKQPTLFHCSTETVKYQNTGTHNSLVCIN